MAKKLESTFLNMLIVMAVIAILSALALGYSNAATKEIIAGQQKKKTLAAISTVVPGFDNDPNAEAYTVPGFEGLEFYPAKKEGTLIGTAVKTFSEGFTEAVWIMVGFDTSLKIITTSVLGHKETPGLGSKMSEPKFKNQFDGKDLSSFDLKVKKDGGAIDAISAATISSRAFSAATQKAYDALLKQTATQKEADSIKTAPADSVITQPDSLIADSNTAPVQEVK